MPVTTRKSLPLLALLLALLVSLPITAGAQTPSETPPRVLLFGDSWASLMWFHQSYQQVFDEYGFADVILDGALIGEGGTARSWSQPEALQALSAHLAQTPSLDTVVISLGGNDLLTTWKVSMDSQDEDQLLENVWQDLEKIVETVLSVRPDIEVLLMGYDYTNFFETQDADPTGRTARAWQQLGRPRPLEVNQLTVRLELLKVDLALSSDRVHYVQAFGLMQYVFGYPNPSEFIGEGFEAFTVPFPGQAASGFDPFPGGNPAYPSPPAAMALQGSDPIHLNESAYYAIAALQMEAYFLERFRGDPAVEVAAAAEYSGWVRSDGVLDVGGLVVGAEGESLRYRTILSFDTAPIHNRAEITRASLYLVRSGDCCGDNPFTSDSFGPPQLALAPEGFGDLELQTADFADPSGLNEAGIFHGSARDGGHTLRIDLSPAALQAINKRGLTQLRIAFPQNSDGIGTINFHLSGEDAPRLDVYYDRPSFSLLDLYDPDSKLGGIPLPTVTTLFALCCLAPMAALVSAWAKRRRYR